MVTNNINEIKGKIIFKAIVGSQAYGTNTATSDVDIKGVYIQDTNDLIRLNQNANDTKNVTNYKPQVIVNKDETYFELSRFIELLYNANPTVLEMLYMPEDCILIKEPEFDLIVEQREQFLSSKCFASFANYAIAQVKKAKGLDKMMNWERDRTVRKTPFDFCYVIDTKQTWFDKIFNRTKMSDKTIPLSTWLANKGYGQENCGLVKLNHFREVYALFYSKNNTKNYRGVVFEQGNDIRLSAVAKGETPLVIMYYNKDGYTNHCDDYKKYLSWLENRNTARYVDTTQHGQQYDGKNLLHCRRLIDTALEIAENKFITVRRPNKDELLSIRRGEMDLSTIIERAEKDSERLKQLEKTTDLPSECDWNMCVDLVDRVRNLKF